MTRTRRWPGAVAASALIAAALTPAQAAPPAGDQGAAQLAALLEAIGTGDQAAYERYALANYSPAALKAYSAEDWGSSLARIYLDTGGLALDRVVETKPGKVNALGHSRLTGLSYCLSLDRSKADGRDVIDDLNTRALFPAGPNLKPPTPAELTGATERLAAAFDSKGHMSGVVLLAKDDRVFFRRAYGKASLAYDVPMTLDTRLSTASIGKSFTAVAIAQLIDAGKLSFDDTVGKVLPDYPDATVREKVTIRQLLTHTSGLGDHYDHPKWPILRARITTVGGYMDLVKDRPLASQPGEKYEYSNAGYVLLGAIVEKLSGQDFYDYVRDQIFIPAGMTNSFYPIADAEEPRMATPLTEFRNRGDTGYVFKLGRPRTSILENAARGGPQGGASVTGDDLMAFDIAFHNAKLTSPEMVKLMTTPSGPSVSGRRGVIANERPGLGMQVISLNGHTKLGHAGGDFGIISFAYHYPDTGYTVAVLTNRDRPGRVLNAMLDGLITRQTLRGAEPPRQDCSDPPAP